MPATSIESRPTPSIGQGRRIDGTICETRRMSLAASADRDALLHSIDRYLDAAPRTAATVETIGPFSLFVNAGNGWRYYARPTPGAGPTKVEDVRAVRRRQRELRQPEAFEWIVDLAASVADAARGDGLAVREHPIMMLDLDTRSLDAGGLDAAVVRIVADDADLAVLNAVAEIGFTQPGLEVGSRGAADVAEVAARQSAEIVAFQRERIARGLTVAASAEVRGVTAAVGWHNPVGGTTEVVGVATLPAFRRRGLGLAITRALVRDALERGIDTVFLTAGDLQVARMYGRAGFRRVGTAGAAEPAT
jgi:ribosomal protein S18 acetylase RimI-like enzyme